MQRKGQRILFIVMGLALVGFVIGYLVWNKPHEDVKDTDAVETDAVSLYNTFTKDAAEAKSNYLNKIVQVSGVVQGISANQQQQQIILLKTSVPGASVNCTMEQNSDKIKQGDTITLKGICSGYMGGDADLGIPGDVFLIRCYPLI